MGNRLIHVNKNMVVLNASVAVCEYFQHAAQCTVKCRTALLILSSIQAQGQLEDLRE
jgi:hypothetical protein